MISWISQTTLLKLPGPADLLYTTLGRSGPFFRNMQHNSLFKLLFCPDWAIAMLSWQVFQPVPFKLLQLIQNAAARLIFNELKRTHVTPLFINLHWLPIAARIKFKALMFAYKITTGSAPLYLNSVLQTYVPSRSLHSASEQRITSEHLTLNVEHTTHKNYLHYLFITHTYFSFQFAHIRPVHT